MTPQQIGECWLFCVKTMCGVSWDFTHDGHRVTRGGLIQIDPEFADSIQLFVDRFQHVWHDDQSTFFHQLLMPARLALSDKASDGWDKSKQLGMGFLPMVRGSLLEWAWALPELRELGGSLIKVATPEPFMFCPPHRTPMKHYPNRKNPCVAIGNTFAEFWPNFIEPPGIAPWQNFEA